MTGDYGGGRSTLEGLRDRTIWEADSFHCGSDWRIVPALKHGGQTLEHGRSALTQISTHKKLRSVALVSPCRPGLVEAGPREPGGWHVSNGTASQRSQNQSQVQAEAVTHRTSATDTDDDAPEVRLLSQSKVAAPQRCLPKRGRKESRLVWIPSVTGLRVLRLSCSHPCGGIPLREMKGWLLLALSAERSGVIAKEQHAGLALCSSSGPNRPGPEVPGLEQSAGRDHGLMSPRRELPTPGKPHLRGDCSAQPPSWTSQTHGFLRSRLCGCPPRDAGPSFFLAWVSSQCSEHSVLEGLLCQEHYR